MFPGCSPCLSYSLQNWKRKAMFEAKSKIRKGNFSVYHIFVQLNSLQTNHKVRPKMVLVGIIRLIGVSNFDVKTHSLVISYGNPFNQSQREKRDLVFDFTCSDNGASASMLWLATLPTMMFGSVSRTILNNQTRQVLKHFVCFKK